MATELTNTLKRVIRLHGIESPVIVAIDKDKITVSIPGCKNKLSADWLQVVGQLSTPPNCLSYLEGRPIEFLKQQVAAKKKKGATEGS